MKVLTQFGLLDINPANVDSIRPASVIPELIKYCNLTYYVSFNDSSVSYESRIVYISETDALKLSELAGIELPERKKNQRCTERPIFVPFKTLLILNEWEKHFKVSVKRGINPEWKPDSYFSGDRTLYEENHQPGSAVEQFLEKQNNCIGCGKLVYDESRICSTCFNEPGIIEDRQ